jgi:hypothetical protein
MKKSVLAQAAIVLVILTAVVGCRSTTGQTIGANIDDAKTTAAVKAKLVADHLRDLTAVDVDTVGGTVYLKGYVATQAEKDRAAQLASSVSGVRAVVNNLQVRTAALGAPPVITTAPPPTTAAPPVTTTAPLATTTAPPVTTTAPPAASPATTQYAGTHVMSGRVTSVDPVTGDLGLRTAEADMVLQFPRALLNDMRVGDQVTVQVERTPAR